MSRLNPAAVLCLIFSVIAGKGTPAQAFAEQAEGKIKVFVSIQPQAFFVEKVGGEHVDVDILLPAGQSPHSFEPLPRQLVELVRAKVFFRIGVPYEQSLLSKISSIFTGLEVVDTRKGIELRLMQQGGDHDRNNGNRHEKGSPDPHVWLDPKLVKVQAENICEGLRQIDPEHAEDYRSNLLAFKQELDEVDARITGILAPFKGKSIYVFHPAYGYFTDSYGLRQVALETGGREPSARELVDIIGRMSDDSVKVIFIQPEFSGTVVNTLQNALNCRVIRMDPLARDYICNLVKIAENISQALKSL